MLEKILDTYNVGNIKFGFPNLGSHVQNKHSDAMFTRQKCIKACKNEKRLNNHIIGIHATLMVCENCSKVFQQWGRFATYCSYLVGGLIRGPHPVNVEGVEIRISLKIRQKILR